jgi:hypothetical protein
LSLVMDLTDSSPSITERQPAVSILLCLQSMIAALVYLQVLFMRMLLSPVLLPS